MTEKELKKQVMLYLKDKGIFWKTSDRFQVGLPDIVGILKPSGKFVAIELKIYPNKPTKMQQYILNKTRLFGGIAILAYSIEEVKRLLDG